MISRYFNRPNVVLNHEQGSKKKRESNSNERCWRDFLKECWTVKSYCERSEFLDSTVSQFWIPEQEWEGCSLRDNWKLKPNEESANWPHKPGWKRSYQLRAGFTHPNQTNHWIIKFAGSVLIVKGVGCELSGKFLECVSKLGSPMRKKRLDSY